MNIDEIFNKLWEIYTQNNPTSKKVYDLFTNAGEKVLNDHIAFRTFNLPKINIDSIANVFIKNGYEYKQDYHFKDKKLNAKHYEHSVNSLMPKIFISELIIEEFSDEFQQIIKDIYSQINFKKLDKDEIIYAGRLWGKPSYKIYERLRQESEYAAWLYYNGFVANHFTINVNELKIYDSLEKVNDFLKENDFQLNDSGGEIKGSKEELLEQSSIKADIIDGEFLEGIFKITGCYYEFARRYPDNNGKLYTGFIAKSADKIFESTDLTK